MTPDVLIPDIRIVFCGTDPGQKFGEILHRVGLTPVRLMPPEYKLLSRYGLRLVASEGRTLTARVKEYRPQILCFNGKKGAKIYFQNRNIDYGFQQQTIGLTRIFVAPSTAASAGRYWDERWWFVLADSIGTNVTKISPANYFQPDEVCRSMKVINQKTGRAVKVTEADFINAVRDIELHYSIPLHIKNMFEISKALFAYGYLYYPFCTLATEQALKSLEAVISLKYDLIGGQKVTKQGFPPVLADKINYLYSKRLVSKAQKEVLHNCRLLRNLSFHSGYQQILGHYVETLSIICLLMNDIWKA